MITQIGFGAKRRLGAIAGVFLLIMLVASPALGSDLDSAVARRATWRAHPTVKGNLPASVRRQLTLAFRSAQDSIRARPTCSALFDRFGMNGLELLTVVEFESATMEMVGDTCSRGGVAAFTKVKGRTIKLCPGFGVLPVPKATVILIHELLHTAGMSERPLDPNGLLPQEINRLVAVSCGR
jgi:hypothetical protein